MNDESQEEVLVDPFLDPGAPLPEQIAPVEIDEEKPAPDTIPAPSAETHVPRDRRVSQE